MINKDLEGLTRRQFLELFGIVAGSLALGLYPSQTEANSLFVELNDENYKGEILDYNGAALVLFYGGNFEKSPHSRYMFGVFEALAKEYANKPVDRFNGKLIKFGIFDADQYNKVILTKEQKVARMKDNYGIDAFPTTIMYEKGKEIDRLRGGPGEKGIEERTKFLGEEWVGTNITAPNGQYYWRFNNTTQEQKVYYSAQQK